MTSTTKTRRIAGYDFTLTVGRIYLACRPMATRRGERFNVTIVDITDGFHFDARPEVTIAGLTYDQANEILNRFNNGLASFAGRDW